MICVLKMKTVIMVKCGRLILAVRVLRVVEIPYLQHFLQNPQARDHCDDLQNEVGFKDLSCELCNGFTWLNIGATVWFLLTK